MNLQNKLKGLYKVGMSADEIVELLSDALIDMFVYEYSKKKAITSHFELIGIYNTQKWKGLLTADPLNVIRTQLNSKLNAVKCVRDAINESSSSDSTFKKLNVMLKSHGSNSTKKIDERLCTLLLQQDPTTFNYVAYDMDKLITPTSIDEKVALNIFNFVMHTYATSIDRYNNDRNDLMISIRSYLQDIKVARKMLTNTYKILEQYKDDGFINMYNIAQCCIDLVYRLPEEYTEELLETILSLRHALSKDIQVKFVNAVLEYTNYSRRVSFKQCIKIAMLCVAENATSAETIAYFLQGVISGTSYSKSILHEIASLDRELAKQFYELIILLATFSKI